MLCICNLFHIRQIRDAFDHGHTTRNKVDLQIQSCLKRFLGMGPRPPSDTVGEGHPFLAPLRRHSAPRTVLTREGSACSENPTLTTSVLSVHTRAPRRNDSRSEHTFVTVPSSDFVAKIHGHGIESLPLKSMPCCRNRRRSVRAVIKLKVREVASLLL